MSARELKGLLLQVADKLAKEVISEFAEILIMLVAVMGREACAKYLREIADDVMADPMWAEVEQKFRD